jgi:hypothetical protein
MIEHKASMAVLGKEAASALAAVESQQQRVTLQRLVGMVRLPAYNIWWFICIGLWTFGHLSVCPVEGRGRKVIPFEVSCYTWWCWSWGTIFTFALIVTLTCQNYLPFLVIWCILCRCPLRSKRENLHRQLFLLTSVLRKPSTSSLRWKWVTGCK